jgi:hypothetical protein
VLLSPDAALSEWVERELAFAELLKIPVIPWFALGEESDAIPLRIVSYQWIDARKDWDESFPRLLIAINYHLQKEQ